MTLKSEIKRLLTRLGVLEKIQYSGLYRNYKFPAQRTFMRQNLEFYRKILTDCSLVFDIGANVGDHCYNLSLLSEKVIAVEPDPQNLRVLSARFRNRKNIEIVSKAISNQNGRAKFFSEGPGSPFNSLSSKWTDILSDEYQSRFQAKNFVSHTEVETITVKELIDIYGRPDFLKVDVEGFEKEVFECLDQCVPLVTFECNLPEFTDETIWIIEKLNSLSPGYRYNFFDDYSRFEFDHDLPMDEAIWFIQNTTKRFLEIICKNEEK